MIPTDRISSRDPSALPDSRQLAKISGSKLPAALSPLKTREF
jgi:hypothetical protein